MTHKHPHSARSSVSHRMMQRSRPEAFVSRVRVEAAVDEHLDDIGIARGRSAVEERATVAVNDRRVYTVLDERDQTAKMASNDGGSNGLRSRSVGDVRRRAARKEGRHRFVESGRHCAVQRRQPVTLGEIRGRAELEQGLDCFSSAVKRREMKRSFSHVSHAIRQSSRPEERP